MSYFVGLNYGLANEDTRVELALMPQACDSALAVSGSGARVLPLLARYPESLTVIDISREQLYLCELRVAAARELPRDRFLQLLGYMPCDASERERLFGRLTLSKACRDYWADGAAVWRRRGFIWLGRWENHFLRINRLLRLVLGSQIDRIFEARTLEEQRALYQRHWSPKLFRAFLKLVASEWVFDRFLYRGHFAGKSDRRTEEREPWRFFEEEFARIFDQVLVRENYFFQMLFLGELRYPEGFPLEASQDVLEQVSRSKTRVEYLRDDLIRHTQEHPYSFYSLSDTFSYFPEEAARGFLERFHARTPSGALAVIRSFLRSPGTLKFDGWAEQAEAQARARALDFTGVYRFHVFRKGVE